MPAARCRLTAADATRTHSAPCGYQTTLRFTHSGWKAMTDFCASCNSMWGQLMYRLKGFVEGTKP